MAREVSNGGRENVPLLIKKKIKILCVHVLVSNNTERSYLSLHTSYLSVLTQVLSVLTHILSIFTQSLSILTQFLW